jgi:hypothetical protein
MIMKKIILSVLLAVIASPLGAEVSTPFYNQNYIARGTISPHTSKIVFYDETNTKVGELRMTRGYMEFSGNMHTSARAFFQYLKDNMVDPYMRDFCDSKTTSDIQKEIETNKVRGGQE